MPDDRTTAAVAASVAMAVDWRLVLAVVALLAGVLFALLAASTAGAQAGRGYRRHFTGSVERRLNDMLLFIDGRRLFAFNLLAAAVVIVAVWGATRSLALVAVSLVLLAAAPGIVLARLGRRRRARFGEQLPDVLMLVAGALRAGASLPLALRQVAAETRPPAGQEFELILREQRLGASLDQALGSLERRMGGDELRLFTAAIRIAGESGGNLAETLERLADAIRKRLAIEGKIDALTAQGRLQGWIMALLPVAVGLALVAIEPEAMEPLFVTWQGWSVLAVVAGLEMIGLLMIRRIMSIDV